jgi:hypothetical protein
MAINCHSESNGDYGYELLEDVDDASSLINCSDFGNTNGRKQYNDNSTYNTYDVGPITLSASGITSTTDLTPTVSGNLRGSGMAFNNDQTTFLDLGAVTHTPASGGGGNTYHPLANPNSICWRRHQDTGQRYGFRRSGCCSGNQHDHN